jgi:hypothetical protein
MYAREAGAVLVFLARRTLDVAVAADLTAETFALAFSSWSRLRCRVVGGGVALSSATRSTALRPSRTSGRIRVGRSPLAGPSLCADFI